MGIDGKNITKCLMETLDTIFWTTFGISLLPLLLCITDDIDYNIWTASHVVK